MNDQPGATRAVFFFLFAPSLRLLEGDLGSKDTNHDNKVEYLQFATRQGNLRNIHLKRCTLFLLLSMCDLSFKNVRVEIKEITMLFESTIHTISPIYNR